MSCGDRNARNRSTAVSDENQFTGVKVFSATMADQREKLGERIAAWLALYPTVRVVDKVVLQSSDQGFHCLSITLFYVDEDEPDA